MTEAQQQAFNQLHDDLARAHTRIKQLEGELQGALQGIVPDPEIYDGSYVFVQPGVRADNGEGFVTIRISTSIIQTDTINAIGLGQDIIAMAEAAHSDSVLFRFFRDQLGVDGTGEQLGRMIDSYRAQREAEKEQRKLALSKEG